MLLFTIIFGDGAGLSLIGVFLFLLASLVMTLLFPLLIPIYTIVYRPAIIMSIKIPVAIIKILIFLFIQLPLYGVGHSSTWIWNVVHASISNTITSTDNDDDDGFSRRPKYSYVILFLTLLSATVYVVGVDFSTFTAMMRDATLISIPLVLFPFILTLIISAIHYRISKGKFDDKDFNYNPGTLEVGQSKAGEAKKSSKKAAKKGGAAAAVAGKGIYKGLKHVDADKAALKGAAKGAERQLGSGATQVAKGSIESGGMSIIRSLRGIPAIGKKLAGPLENAIVSEGGVINAGRAAGAAGASTILTIFIYVLAILVALLITWGLIMIVIWAGLGTIFYIFIMPFMSDVFGVGEAYAANIGEDVGGAIGSGPSASLDAPSPEMNALRLAGARVSCMMEGPQCMREWQANNTQRPGSESVGQEFGLEIEQFTVNNGLTLDISTRNKDDNIPIEFDVYNPIQGLRGVEARDVQYRVAVDGGPTTNCVSDWEPLGGQFVGDQDNSILPGGFARPSSTGGLEEFTLENCGALQPGLGQDMSAELQIKYDYSSQSTLDFQVMEESHMIDQEIRPEPTQSETANTPVMTYLNVQSPVVYRDQEGDRAPITFPVFVGFETEQFDIEYHIEPEDLQIYGSQLLNDTDNVSPQDFDIDTEDEEFEGDQCEDLNQLGGDMYNLSDNYAGSIIDTQEAGTWYSRGRGPTAASCEMVLDPDFIDAVSPTGETVSMRVDGNYTVRLSSSSESFEVINDRCTYGGINCPMIVTQNESESVDGNISARCNTATSIDATDGCSVIENDNSWASNPNELGEIENRQTAYWLENAVGIIDDSLPDDEDDEDDGDYIRVFDTSLFEDRKGDIVGLDMTPDELEDFDQPLVVYFDDRSNEFQVTEDEEVAYCEGDGEEEIKSNIEEDLGIPEDNILHVRAREVDDSWWEQHILHERFEDCA